MRTAYVNALFPPGDSRSLFLLNKTPNATTSRIISTPNPKGPSMYRVIPFAKKLKMNMIHKPILGLAMINPKNARPNGKAANAIIVINPPFENA